MSDDEILGAYEDACSGDYAIPGSGGHLAGLRAVAALTPSQTGLSRDLPNDVAEAAWNAAFPGIPECVAIAESKRRAHAAARVAWDAALLAVSGEATTETENK